MRQTWIVVIGALLFVPSAFACEPIVPLFQLLAGGTLAGPALLANSAVWLGLAVALKCGAFVFLERRLVWHRAIIVMLLANVVSTIPGILVAAFAASGTIFGLVLSLPVVCALAWAVQRRLALFVKTGPIPLVSVASVMLGFIGLFILSWVLFARARHAFEMDEFVAYWVVKFLFVTAAASMGILISAVTEECVIAWLERKPKPGHSFYPSVFRANYITLGAALLVTAVRLFPARLRSPHFITSWLHSFFVAIGLA